MDWIVSDTHFNHKNIIKYCNRPFSTTQEMDEVILDSINSLVQPNDILWHLGDFCFGPNNPDAFMRVAEGYRNRIKCRNVIWIHGNHDPDPASHRRNERNLANRFKQLFIEDYALRRTMVLKTKVTFCHYAIVNWDKAHRNSVHYYGHSHSDIENWMDTIMPGRKSMDAGVDNIAKILGRYGPISAKEGLEIFNSRLGFSRHHVKED